MKATDLGILEIQEEQFFAESQVVLANKIFLEKDGV